MAPENDHAGHIFLSYSRKDKVQAGELATWLQRAGYRPWIDTQGIAAGEQWRREIVRALEKAQAMLILLSPNSVRSDNVRRELDLADTMKLKVIPVEIAPVELSPEIKYQLAGIQFIDIWRDQRHGGRLLLSTLEQHLGRRPAQVTFKADGASLQNSRGQGPDLSQLGGAGPLEQLSNIGRLFGRKR